MLTTKINFEEFISKYDKLLEKGLSPGLGQADGQMCIEALICNCLGLPHGEDPDCVHPYVISFNINLNDLSWSSPQARAAGLRDLGIAQLGSKNTISGIEFFKKLSTKAIQILIPAMLREIFPKYQECLKAADLCESEPTRASILKARETLNAAYVIYAAIPVMAAAAELAAQAVAEVISYINDYYGGYTSNPAIADAAAYATLAAAEVAKADNDKYLKLLASLALEVLIELGSPGAKWINFNKPSSGLVG